MKKEERIKLEINKLEKERNEHLIYFIGLFAAFISASIPILIKLTGKLQIFVGAWIILIISLLSIVYILWKNKLQKRIDQLYLELGVPYELTKQEATKK